ncbi:hypothetical protein M8818_003663 [Zalaria obscura]|uniref:Uncharacterized protein n=1 Tax=Zalaria obscura TaxID=2024903 RepID=A0ACC3SEX3_9PEZI
MNSATAVRSSSGACWSRWSPSQDDRLLRTFVLPHEVVRDGVHRRTSGGSPPSAADSSWHAAEAQVGPLCLAVRTERPPAYYPLI